MAVSNKVQDKPVPTKPVPTMCYLKEGLRRQVERVAEAQDGTLTDVINELIEYGLVRAAEMETAKIHRLLSRGGKDLLTAYDLNSAKRPGEPLELPPAILRSLHLMELFLEIMKIHQKQMIYVARQSSNGKH